MFEVKSYLTAAAFYCLLLSSGIFSATDVYGDEATTAKVSPDKLIEPIFRVPKPEKIDIPPSTKTALVAAPAEATSATVAELKPHPLDRALKMATQALAKSKAQVDDYTAVLVKRERIDGRLNDESYMVAKVRNEKTDETGAVQVPFSVYLRFLKPSSVKGREVIYVRGHNKGKLIAHEGGFKGKFTPSLHLDPLGTLAMMGQRYPITDIGIENLCVKLLKRGRRDRAVGMCQVKVTEATVNKRAATRIEVIHPERKHGLDFHIARIFVDQEYQLPIRYEAYDWPASADGKVTENDLIEEYTYIRLKLNVGLKDIDFDSKNPKYNM